MGNKFVLALNKGWDFIKRRAWFALLVVTIGLVIYWAIHGLAYGVAERLESYLRILVLLGMVIAFALLRLYNSNVANTRYLIKLRSAVKKLELALLPLERQLKNSSSSVDRTSTTIKGMGEKIVKLNSSIDDLDSTIQRLESIGKNYEK